MSVPPLSVVSTVLGAPDALRLAQFYSKLLGWQITYQEPGWVMLSPGPGTHGLSFQTEDGYEPPVWPAEPGEQQMMMHLDIHTPDLPAGVDHALSLGARLADFQPQDNVRVCLDPAGHPFCLFSE